jgi:hypothetical protein
MSTKPYEAWSSTNLPKVARIHPKERRLYEKVRAWWATLVRETKAEPDEKRGLPARRKAKP